MSEIKSKKIQFAEFHQPILQDGDYQVSIEQTISNHAISENNVFKSEINFSVGGEQFRIQPTEIEAVFPPAGSLGEHSNVLPHLVINRNTLPWERRAQKDNGNAPWLALLVFQANELHVSDRFRDNPEIPLSDKEKEQAKNGTILTLGDMEAPDPSIAWPGIDYETGQHHDDKANFIFVKKEVLAGEVLDENQLVGLAPTLTELAQLTHTRQGKEPKGDEFAVIMGKRLPKAGVQTIVHLVSVENRYTTEAFDFQTAAPEALIPLVSLKSWRFSCLRHKHTFKGLLAHLNQRQVFGFPIPVDLPDGFVKRMLPISKLPFLIFLLKNNKEFLSDNATIIDEAEREIINKDHFYIISKSKKIYDQAGFLIPESKLALSTKPINDNLNPLGNKDKEDSLKIDLNQAKKTTKRHYWWIQDGDNLYFLNLENGVIYAHHQNPHPTSGFHLPPSSSDTLNKYLNIGYVPCPHYFREGSRAMSLYRGPLIPTATSTIANVTLPADLTTLQNLKSSDQLLRYFEEVEMFDTSYAAAYELGKLLALNSKSFSIALNHWKRTHRRSLKLAEQRLEIPHLTHQGRDGHLSELPENITAWFDKLWQLQGVPFNYLIPDEKLLPKESIRFFNLDTNWMDCLIHGAFSFGQVIGSDGNRTNPAADTLNSQFSAKQISGFLLRSELVSGWPNLKIEGFSEIPKEANPINQTGLTLYRKNIAPDILLCLFEGKIKAVDFFLPPEVLHYGFDFEETDGGEMNYIKHPRNNEGKVGTISIPIKFISTQSAPRVVNFKDLFAEIQKNSSSLGFNNGFNVADFALAMIEGADRVRWTI